MIATRDITGLILCGGRGTRMGGVDKGLQNFHGLPLALHQLRRLQSQTGANMINANRHLAAYEAFGVPVWPDIPVSRHRSDAVGCAQPSERSARRIARPIPGVLASDATQRCGSMASADRQMTGDATLGHAGPLAGFLVGLEHCPTPWLLTLPCDTPLFPPDLAARLAAAACQQGADIAMAAAPEADGAGAGRLRPQPVFCLLRVELLESLRAFIAAGGRKVDAWTARHRCASVPFDQAGDDPRAFININTLAQLHALQSHGADSPALRR